VEEISVSNLSFLNPFKIASLCKKFRQDHFDTIILNLPADIKTAGISAKRAGIKNIIYRRGMPHPIKNTLINRYIFGQVLDCVIANSQTIKESILANNQNMIEKSKIKVIYNGIDTDSYDQMVSDKLYHKVDGELVIGNAGRLVEQKGQKYLIDLAARLKQRAIPFKILIAGTGPLLVELKDYAKAQGVENDIEFLGFVSNIKSFMDSIDIFVFPSLFEGSANTILEAMFFAKPVITHNVSSMPELIKDNVNGFLIPVGDIELLTSQVVLLNENPELIERIGKQNHQTIIEEYQTKQKIAELEKLL
jgi:glycosyltransferase involved in cell wall biosynthesis